MILNEDGSTDISLLLKFDQDHWQTLKDYTTSNTALTEDMFRRAVAYVEEAVYKPSLAQKVAIAWSEYIQSLFIEYKTYITWCCGGLAAFGVLFWLWMHMSHKHVIILVIAALYLYEVVISYKEAEKQELDRFLSAVNKCSWHFWKSSCEVPPPDPIIFMKHMNPLKIGIRMFTTFLSEPMLVLSSTVNTMINEITGGLWFPLDVILHCILIISINIMLIVLLVMIIFNYILNIPFSLNLFGLMSIGVKQCKRSLNVDTSSNSPSNENTDRISSATLERILDVCSRALDTSRNVPQIAPTTSFSPISTIKRSASTGRLPSSSVNSYDAPESTTRKRTKPLFMIGGGDSRK
ncbi:uncharacterized protein LOC114351560 [Ostrinia furnacalis]|uniref:uncharacterized protein LOC114351560 n=1 Tax=Ostrinia furnacalis TaxID=93504 RepID=UPI00103E7A59|nr:uncharacterized protein LOC114351560 [Ostrinia furnacalis]